MVAICLATTTGWLAAVWMVAKDGDVLGRGQQARGPGHRFQHAAVKIGLAAIADPAGDRQHEVDARLIQHLGQFQVVVPAVHPAFGRLRRGHARGAVGGKGAKRKRSPESIGFCVMVQSLLEVCKYFMFESLS
jgi:hypothetical protein